MLDDGRLLLEECRRARAAATEGVDVEALRAEAGRMAGILVDPAH
ncbi:hypothetical protein [Actinocorallia libanotica]|uniref:Uncharacterized protein n=1 Tax=Actinocorallia libanotica TaxID=46162 RepID=A0ABN1QWI5_9ACTN